MNKKMSWTEEKQLVNKTATGFPEHFGLRAFPGKIFQINEQQSYVQYFTTGEHVVQLVIDVIGPDGKAQSFSKGQPHEITMNMVVV